MVFHLSVQTEMQLCIGLSTPHSGMEDLELAVLYLKWEIGVELLSHENRGPLLPAVSPWGKLLILSEAPGWD